MEKKDNKKQLLLKWIDGEIEDEDEVFDFTLDLYTLYEFAPRVPNSEEDVNKIISGVESILKAFGYRIRHMISVGGDAPPDAIVTIKQKIKELDWTDCDLLLVKEYDMYIFCIEAST